MRAPRPALVVEPQVDSLLAVNAARCTRRMLIFRSGQRRMFLYRLASVMPAVVLPGCAAFLGHEPLRVNLVGLEPLSSEGMEVRMTVKLRIQNPNDASLDFDGISVELDVDGARLASGVSSERGSVARYAETVVAVPVSISALAVLRQMLEMAGGRNTSVRYALRGQLGRPDGRGMRFSSSGDIDLPGTIGASRPR
jgi:LEA14-like dessication related protein